jgi:glucose-6-phosphate 1-dehydrogenase
MDLAEPNDYRRLKDELDLNPDDQALIYLSVPPSASADIVDFLGQAGLNTPNVKLLFEKPFGFDYDSARDFLDRTAQHFNEDQIYRIDHYMGKDVATRLVALRQSAETHHHSWGNHSIASVEVAAIETLDIEGRAVFYEQTGALRDFLQGHLMELLSLVLMSVPADFDANKLAEYRLKALEQLQPADPSKAVRAQYEGYQQDADNPGSTTETFACVELESGDPNWHGVKLRLTTGKALDRKLSAVVINYQDGTYEVFDEARITVDGRKLDAYERVLLEAIAGRKTIFTTGPEVLRSWQILAPVQAAWELDDQPLNTYPQGSSSEHILSQHLTGSVK